MTDEQTYTTREVADLIDVSIKTVQFWVRERYLTPATEGDGRQKRITWSQSDLDAAMAYKDEQAQAKKGREIRDTLIDTIGRDGLRHFNEALDMHRPRGSVVCAGPAGARVVRLNDTVKTVMDRIGGSGLILPIQ